MKPERTSIVVDMQAKLMPHIDGGKRVFGRRAALIAAADLLVADATGSRTPENKSIALTRAHRDRAVPATTGTAIFGWLESCRHPRFKQVLALVK